MSRLKNSVSALVAACLAAGALAQNTDNPKLAELQKSYDELAAKRNYGPVMAFLGTSRKAVRELIRNDEVRTLTDFQRARALIDDPVSFFANRQVQYELSVTAVFMGDTDSRKFVPLYWDFLIHSSARDQRLGSLKKPTPPSNEIKPFDLDPEGPPKAVLDVHFDYGKAIARATTSRDNAELQAIKDADQAAREKMPTTEAELDKMVKEDDARRQRLAEIIKADGLSTATDLYNAAMLCQHGNTYRDSMMAHELAVASAILGKEEAKWLSAATYDRMLLRMGFRQRFGTQQQPPSGIMLYDEDGINDRIRKVWNVPPLKRDG